MMMMMMKNEETTYYLSTLRSSSKFVFCDDVSGFALSSNKVINWLIDSCPLDETFHTGQDLVPEQARQGQTHRESSRRSTHPVTAVIAIIYMYIRCILEDYNNVLSKCYIGLAFSTAAVLVSYFPLPHCQLTGSNL